MLLRNYTPFSPLYFESRDVSGRDFGVLVLRGTFDIVPGAVLRPNPKQQPIVETDVWHGEPNGSSVAMESDLAPFKPRTDILVNAVAHAPGGRPLPDWRVRVRVGAVEKSLRVTGPRAWVREGGGFRLEDPEPVQEVPVRYERAFGGVWRTSGGEARICEENPVGVGFVDGDVPSGVDRVPAPQIESPDEPVIEWGKRYRPEGLGAIARSWQPRLQRAGKFDEEWKRSRWPELPTDFDFSFYNAAAPGLTAPGFLRGDEEVEMEGLSAEGTVRFSLPAYKFGLLVTRSAPLVGIVPMALDAVIVDGPRSLVFSTWRATWQAPRSVRSVDIRMSIGKG